MADSEEPKAQSCTFLFKKSAKKFCGRKRKASDSDKGSPFILSYVSESNRLVCGVVKDEIVDDCFSDS